MLKPIRINKLNKRLMPLYLAAFFQGFVLWYTVEKLFMRSIGFDDASIGVMVALYSTVMLMIETPSGILADRWSRKGVLILASISLAASAFVGGISDNIPMYILCTLFWGVFFALYTGTYDSIVYDTLLEEQGNTDAFEKHYGHIKIVDSIALVTGSLLGGLIAEVLGTRETYFLSVPLACVSIVALILFKEPRLHKAETAVPLKEHIFSTFRAIARNRSLLPILITLIVFGLIEASLFEFNQLWYIALAIPAIAFGPANALILGTLGIGGFAARYLHVQKLKMVVIFTIVMFASVLLLVLSRVFGTILAAQAMLGIGSVAIGVVLLKLLHDELPSNIRAGSASAVSTLTRIFLIPLSVFFGYISKDEGVFNAAWLWLGLLAVAAVFILKIRSQKLRLIAVEAGDETALETYRK